MTYTTPILMALRVTPLAALLLAPLTAITGVTAAANHEVHFFGFDDRQPLAPAIQASEDHDVVWELYRKVDNLAGKIGAGRNRICPKSKVADCVIGLGISGRMGQPGSDSRVDYNSFFGPRITGSYLNIAVEHMESEVGFTRPGPVKYPGAQLFIDGKPGAWYHLQAFQAKNRVLLLRYKIVRAKK